MTVQRGNAEMLGGRVVAAYRLSTGSVYVIAADDSSESFTAEYSEVVTQGFRTLTVGERVRFMRDHADPARARYVIKLDEPCTDELYGW